MVSVVFVGDQQVHFRFEDLNRVQDLEIKYKELLEEHRLARIELADAVAESGHTIAQLAVIEEEKERLKEALRNARALLQYVFCCF